MWASIGPLMRTSSSRGKPRASPRKSSRSRQEIWPRTRHQSLCEGAEFFDNRYFEISNNEVGGSCFSFPNAEANGMDPVQRLVLECGAQSMAMIGLTKKVGSVEVEVRRLFRRCSGGRWGSKNAYRLHLAHLWAGMQPQVHACGLLRGQR